jgi:hypothetical protein
VRKKVSEEKGVRNVFGGEKGCQEHFRRRMEQALEGSVNESLNLDSHGKSWSFLLLALSIELEV